MSDLEVTASQMLLHPHPGLVPLVLGSLCTLVAMVCGFAGFVRARTSLEYAAAGGVIGIAGIGANILYNIVP